MDANIRALPVVPSDASLVAALIPLLLKVPKSNTESCSLCRLLPVDPFMFAQFLLSICRN